jgi:hypothetical protein
MNISLTANSLTCLVALWRLGNRETGIPHFIDDVQIEISLTIKNHYPNRRMTVGMDRLLDLQLALRSPTKAYILTRKGLDICKALTQMGMPMEVPGSLQDERNQ